MKTHGVSAYLPTPGQILHVSQNGSWTEPVSYYQPSEIFLQTVGKNFLNMFLCWVLLLLLSAKCLLTARQSHDRSFAIFG